MRAAIDSSIFRRTLGNYPTGVCVVTAVQDDGTPVGMSVGSFTSVSLDPPLVGFFPDRKSTSWPRIQSAGRFCVNVLADHQEPICRVFASKAEDKFAGIPYRPAPGGSPILDGVLAWIDCELHSVQGAGDHYLVLGQVRSLEIGHSGKPLLFFQGGYGKFLPLVTEVPA